MLGYSGKTALLFHYAVKLARTGKTVLYVRPASKYDEIPPMLPHGVHGLCQHKGRTLRGEIRFVVLDDASPLPRQEG